MDDDVEEIDAAICFVESYRMASILEGTRRRGLIARWVRAKYAGKTDAEARKDALVGMPIWAIWAMIIAHVIFKLLVRWWEKRRQ